MDVSWKFSMKKKYVKKEFCVGLYIVIGKVLSG